MNHHEYYPADSERSYIAFISYRHLPLDTKAAEMIQRRIERYIVPSDHRKEPDHKKLGIVFRDDDELPASSNLSQSVYYALDRSDYLIMICTPDLPASKWCEQELKYFLEHHDRDHVIAVLVDGTSEESFPPLLLHTYDEQGNVTGDIEPLAANIVGTGHTINKKVFPKESTRILAALIGCPFDELWQREHRARVRRLLTISGSIFAAMMVFMGILLNQNSIIRKQNTDLLRKISTASVESGLLKLDSHDVDGALEDALQAVDSHNPGIIDPRYESLFVDALSTYTIDHLKSSMVYSQSTDIKDVKIVDPSHTVILDDTGTLRCLDAKYHVTWEKMIGDRNARIYSRNLDDRVLVKTADSVFCYDLSSGDTLWTYAHNTRNYFQALSDDGSVFAVLDNDQENTYHQNLPAFIVFLDTENGGELGRVSVNKEGFSIRFDTAHFMNPLGTDAPDMYGAAFSKNNALFTCLIQYDPISSDANTYFVFSIDMKTMTGREIGSFQDDGHWCEIVYGMDIEEESGNCYFARYSNRDKCILSASYDAVSDTWNTEQTNAMINVNDLNGYEILEDQVYQTPKMISWDSCVFVFHEQNMYVFDKKTSQLIQSFELSGIIKRAELSGAENHSLQIFTSDGSILVYDLGTASFEVTQLQGFQTDLSNIYKIETASNIAVADTNSKWFAVCSEQQTALLKTEYVSDPSAQSVFSTENGAAGKIILRKIPQSDNIMLFFSPYQSQETSVSLYDPAKKKLHDTVTFPDKLPLSSSVPFVMDESHFVMENKIYNLSGKTTELEGTGAEGPYSLFAASIEHVSLSNGQLLSYLDLSSSLQETPNPVWVDGDLVTASCDVKSGLCFSECKKHVLGENGMVVGYGTPFSASSKDSADRFFFFDALTSSLSSMENIKPETEDFLISIGTEQPIMVAAYDDGTVYQYDIESQSTKQLGLDYSSGEIVSICFSPEDRYLVVLTTSGNLDLYDLKNDTVQSVGHASYLEKATRIAADYNQNSGKLFLTGRSVGDMVSPSGPLVCINPEKGVIDYQLNSVFLYNSLSDSIYRDFSDATQTRVVSFPIHHLNDYAVLAQKMLGKKE